VAEVFDSILFILCILSETPCAFFPTGSALDRMIRMDRIRADVDKEAVEQIRSIRRDLSR
jgi:hypothetical protein